MHGSLHLVPDELATLGYTDLSHVSETDTFHLYHGRTQDKQAVLIKTPVSGTRSTNLVHQFEHEFEISSDLNPDYVVRPNKIERGAKLTALILEDCPFPPLSELLTAPLKVESFLTLAIGITSALAEIHRQGLVHRNITPGNIFASTDGKVKLSGFGIASKLSRERHSPVQPQDIADTLTYIAPEQTGRMNRSIDTRSDLYALGVIFYQMLTGRLPFQASDPMEWVHCHIAIQPKAPSEHLATLPAPLSDIVMKLLAKAAEDRYQTAEGLNIDLQHCLDEWQEGETIEPFELGCRDIPDTLVIPEKLYGREAEVKMLLESVDRVVKSGKAEWLLVSGNAGVGKSALVNEMLRSLVSPKALFAEGKFDQYQRTTPYATFAQALQALVRQILGKSDKEIAQWRLALIQAVGPNGRLVTDLAPDLVTLIGEQPPIAEVPPQDSQNRFNTVIQQVINIFAKPEHPLVLFLDDLQWLDTATLRLLEYLLTNPSIKHLLLLGAYRDNEVGANHPLRGSIETIRSSGTRLSQIELKPLTSTDLCQLIADTLHTTKGHVLPLNRLVQQKTGGNPLFATQFLCALGDEKLLTLNQATREWSWNLAQIESTSYSDNVADLMIGKLAKLPAETQQALKQLACLGISAETSTQAMIYEQSEETLHNALFTAVQAGLILRQKEHYRFLHDRVREAAYSLVPEQQRPTVHLHIGNKLLEGSTLKELAENIFDVVNHLNIGADLITLKEKRLELARLNLRAGLKAKTSAAFVTAADYFSKGLALLGADPWSVDYDTALSLYIEVIEAEYINTHYEEAKAIADEALNHVRSPLDRARLGRLKVLIFTQIPDYQKAIDTGLLELQALGIELTETPPQEMDLAEIDNLPLMTDPVNLMAMNMMITLIGSAYIIDPIILRNLTYSMVELSRKSGISAPSIYAYGLFGALLIDQGKIEEAYLFGKAGVNLCTRLNAPEMQSMALNMFNSCIRHWKEPLQDALPDMAKDVEAGLAYGDIENVSYCAIHYCNNLLFSGAALDTVESTADYHLALVKRLRQWYAVSFLNITRQTVQNLTSPSSLPGTLNGDYAKEDDLLPALIENDNYTLLFWFYTAKTLLNVVFDHAKEAAHFAEKAKPYEKSSLGLIAVGELTFYHCLALLGCYQGTDNPIDEAAKAILKDNKMRLSHWANHAAENFRHKHHLVLAEEARVEGRFVEAMALYEKAIVGARRSGFTHEAALAYELTARFHLGREMREAARIYLLQAYTLYTQWGALAKLSQLEGKFPHWLIPEGLGGKAEVPLNTTLDTTTLVNASQAVSSEIEPAKLIETLMTRAVENAGADRGLLIIPGSDGIEVEAEAKTGNVGIEVTPTHIPITGIDCARSIINTVAHTLRSIIIDDASHPEPILHDPYLLQGSAKSILCLPLIRRGKLGGILYLENTQTTSAFTQNRLAVLDVLTTQAAISLENARLYDNLKKSEERFRSLLQKVQAAVVVHGADTQIVLANYMAQDLLGLSEAQLLGKTAIDPAWRFLRENGSELPQEEFPVNRVLASRSALQNYVIGIDRPDLKGPIWALVNAVPLFDEAGSVSQVIVSFSDISERRKAEQQLTTSEQLFRTLVENNPDHIARYDLNLRRLYINPALEKQFRVPLKKIIGKTSKNSSPLLDPDGYMANLRKAIQTGQEVADEIAFRSPSGETHWANTRFAPEFDHHGKVQSVLVISTDTTEQKRAESERLDYMRLLESLDRINRVFQTEGDIEKIMHQALDEVLAIFDCDRAYLIYPCDPKASFWSVPIERTTPDYPGAGSQGAQPMDETMSCVMQALLEANHPLQIGPGSDYAVSPLAKEQYNTQSVMAMILRPRIDKPWQFGIQQCTHERIWNDPEVRLFEEIGHRLSDGLNSLLISRNLRESEARFRLVFKSSPVCIQEEDYSAVKAYLESLRPEFGDNLADYLDDHPEVVQECAALVHFINVNDAALRLHEAENKQALLKGLPQIFVAKTLTTFPKILVSLMAGETSFHLESALQTLKGREYPINAFFSVSPGYEQDWGKILVSLIDISEVKEAELERQQHLHFLESLDRINLVLKSEGNMEEILSRTLDVVLDIFDCDRAYLEYPCDPDAGSEWWMPMERWKPEYPPPPLPPGKYLSHHPHLVQSMAALLERDTPLCIGPGTDWPIPTDITEMLGVRSVIAVAIYPKMDRPWQFGIHQCAYARVWTDQEARLLKAIGHRLSDGLNSLLTTRNLRESEERYRLVFDSSPVCVQEEDYSAVKTHLETLQPQYGDDLAGYLKVHPEVVEQCASLVKMINVNHAAVLLHEAKDKQALLEGLPQIFLPETMDAYRQVLIFLMGGLTHFRLESEIKTLKGRRQHIDTFISVCPGYEQSLGRVLVSLVDISEVKQAEQERQEHLYLLESLDRINRVLQEEGEIEQVMNNALDEVLAIFQCDRVYLLYPCDPDSPYWSVPMERNKPEYPGVLELGHDMPMNELVAWETKLVLDSEHPVRVGPGTEYPVAEFLQKNFNIRSFMATALYPRVDKPWQLGLHQCAYDRVWSDQELRLFEEIGHRLSDGLNDLLVMLNLRESEERFRLVYENSPVSIWEEDFSALKPHLDELIAQYGDELENHLIKHPNIVQRLASLVRIVNVNSTTLELHEADSKEELYGELPKTFIAESYDAFRKELIALSRGETELLIDGVVQTLKGKRRDVTVSFSVCPGYEHNLSKVFVSLLDITQRKRDEENLRLAASVFSTSQEGILISDANNNIIDINPAFSRLTGYSREEALGQNPSFLSAGQHDAAFFQEMWQTIHDTGEWQGEIYNQRKSGQVFPELLSIVAVKDDQGQLQHYVGAFSDISMIKQHEADLDRIAHYDMLTSVPNRRLLRDRLEQAIAYTRRHGKSLAVCYLDLDGFKPINDQFGHEGGDRMLIEIAHRLQAMSRGEDTVARLGGDEFVLLWNEIGSEADCIRALERILEKVSEPMLLENEQVSVSASIGVTLYPDDNVDADSLLRHADHAMYTAKQLGKNRYQIFDARLERQISARTELLAMIERGLEKGEFELYYQPKVDYTTGEIIGFEALLRWNDPVLGLILPNEFLSLIENDSLAIRVGRLVMDKAIRQAKLWDSQGIEQPISFNIFPRHLKARSFIDDLRGAIALHWPEMPSHRLLIEIIETSDLEELEPIEEVINQCVKMGIGFSLDDFGTGYSSLVYLRRLSIEEIKIDKSFVRDMLEDPDDEAIVVGVIRLGQAFGLRVVAEGVENVKQAQYLVDLGCNIVQGYALGRPMPVYAFQKWYANYIDYERALCQS
jgi:diguanylate cyclase (GGDEF)-like protein/PAS domain S-box-containing protein